jgi:rhamnosyltransferase
VLAFDPHARLVYGLWSSFTAFRPSNSPMIRSDVCAIFVTYHPDADFPGRLRSISSQVGALVIVDNGSTDAEVRMLQQTTANCAINLVLNPENLGIARALNIGIERAAALGYRWVLLLDQDSHVHDDLLDTLLAARESHPEKERVAVIGSGYRDLGSGPPDPHPHAAVDRLSDEVDWVITSGSLLSLAAHSVIGAFREEFFIDYVDIEYCIRARASGYYVLNARRSLMSHSIGAPTQHKLLWMRKRTTNHSADRRYYFARNDTVMLREYGNCRWRSWPIKSFMRSIRTCKRIVLYEQAKAGKIFAVFHGWWDGVHGNMGARRR